MKFDSHTVPTLEKPIRILDYCIGIFDSYPTRSSLKKAFKKQYIAVNGRVANSALFICGGEEISISVSELRRGKKLNFPLDVLFEDQHLAMIHKPAGIQVSGNKLKTIANALPQNLKESTLDDSTIPQPVHRLDYATTGILLTGKTSASIRMLNKMFEEKKISKVYYAITIGEMQEKGLIDSPVEGKSSVSEFIVEDSVTSSRFGKLNLVKLLPKTGRRHQLRRHLSEIGHPILGDQEYGFRDKILKGKGLYLHASSLEFTHPFTNKSVKIVDELPQKFRKIFD